ncbi:unnamed protein product [Nippostrongylus brasiliensis]|uniref:Col_cuticle_N domain-containing protein n=1 Tax=Nippostrongylus brasiliensis TaxID=27835 RepID=A0A0N4YPM2_NIPBR|nr:unnamed protein product [Nippostrongylus brasiliensis]
MLATIILNKDRHNACLLFSENTVHFTKLSDRLLCGLADVATTEVPLANPMPPQIIVPRAPPAKRFGCGGDHRGSLSKSDATANYRSASTTSKEIRMRSMNISVLSWVVAAFFIVLLCLTISEITYNRQRDQAFLRLKWAELRQRMLGFELLSQATQQAEAQMQQQQQQQPLGGRCACNNHNDCRSRDLSRQTSPVFIGERQ